MSTEKQDTSYNADFARLIATAVHAEKAGVFARTEVDTAALVAAPQPSRLVKFYERAMVGLPLAACLGIVVGIASFTTRDGQFNAGGVAMVDTNGNAEHLAGIPAGVGLEMVASCVAGPGQPVINGCTAADLDADGDVDLLDLGAYQTLSSATQ